MGEYNCIVLMGPTAVGKTAIGVRLAASLDGEIISADSRQVYRGLDIASGKDKECYNADGFGVPYHLIDICDITSEYSVFDWQRDFYRVFPTVLQRGKIPIVVGGTGMYIDSIVRSYPFIPVPEDSAFRLEAARMTLAQLGTILLQLKGEVHGGEDLRDKARCIRAIEIARYMDSSEGKAAKAALASRPEVKPLVVCTTLAREVLWGNILRRLKERIAGGMIEEIAALHDAGASWQRLEGMGLECRYVSRYIQGKITTVDTLTEQLFISIRQFAKRQETWFRGMGKKGVVINWLPPDLSIDTRTKAALLLTQPLFPLSSRR